MNINYDCSYIELLEQEKILKDRLACITTCPVAVPVAEKKKKGKPMRYRYDEEWDSDLIASSESRKVNYLETRLYMLAEDKSMSFQRQYGLRDDTTPVTPKELVERIQSGMFVIPEEKSEHTHYYGNAVNHIRWRDPAKVEDQAGYEKASKALNAERTKVQDAIQILEPAAGLAAVQAFENWTYSPTSA